MASSEELTRFEGSCMLVSETVGQLEVSSMQQNVEKKCTLILIN